MKQGQSKRKGNIFENKIMKELREICPHVSKTLGSGSSEDNADLTNFFDYMIECKHYRKITDGLLRKWWGELNNQAEKHNKIPVLIFRENNQQTRVMLWSCIKHYDKEIEVSSIVFYDTWKLLLKLTKKQSEEEI